MRIQVQQMQLKVRQSVDNQDNDIENNKLFKLRFEAKLNKEKQNLNAISDLTEKKYILSVFNKIKIVKN